MELTNTEALICKMQKEKIFDACGIYVRLGDERKFISAGNFDMDTYVDVASMGKVLVTSTLVLHAMGEGKIRLTDTLCAFFDGVPEDKKNITVKDLLTHSSGIIRKNLPEAPIPTPHEDVLRFILNTPLGYETGKDYSYSCSGYILLGLILEKVYDMPLSELFSKTTKKTLALDRADFKISKDTPNVLRCYRWNEDNDYRCDDEIACQMGEGAGNGAQFFSMRSMVKFTDAILDRDERLYPKYLYDEAEKLQTEGLSEQRGLGYQLVWENYHQTGKLFPKGSFGHCGHSGQSFFINREKNLVAIILTNATRCLYEKSGFTSYDYGEIKKLRETLHDSIADDLKV